MLFSPVGETRFNGCILRKPGQAVARMHLIRGQKYNFCFYRIAAHPKEKKRFRARHQEFVKKYSSEWLLFMVPYYDASLVALAWGTLTRISISDARLQQRSLA